MNFEKHLNNLEEELCLLSNKIAQARENENWGTYKNLILSYKEILNLISNFNIKVDTATEDTKNNKLKIPVHFFFKEFRCNSNYKTDNFHPDCPIVIDESVDGFEFIIGLSTDSKELKANKKGFKITRKYFKNSLIEKAKEMIGKPYVWGGNTPQDGFDCSGLIQYVYKSSTGLNIGRTTYDQVNSRGNVVAKNELQTGDVIFFGKENNPYHVGLYLGNDEYIHAPKPNDVVKISKLSNRNDYLTARRYF